MTQLLKHCKAEICFLLLLTVGQTCKMIFIAFINTIFYYQPFCPRIESFIILANQNFYSSWSTQTITFIIIHTLFCVHNTRVMYMKNCRYFINITICYLNQKSETYVCLNVRSNTCIRTTLESRHMRMIYISRTTRQNLLYFLIKCTNN